MDYFLFFFFFQKKLFVRADRKLHRKLCYARADLLTVSNKSSRIEGRSTYAMGKILCGSFVVFTGLLSMGTLDFFRIWAEKMKEPKEKHPPGTIPRSKMCKRIQVLSCNKVFCKVIFFSFWTCGSFYKPNRFLKEMCTFFTTPYHDCRDQISKSETTDDCMYLSLIRNINHWLAANIAFYFMFSGKPVLGILRKVHSGYTELHCTCCSTLCFVLIAISHSVQPIRVGDTHLLRGPIYGRASTNLEHHATYKATEKRRGRLGSVEVDSSENTFNIPQVCRYFTAKRCSNTCWTTVINHFSV